jgi:hypothetical protein
MQFTDLYAICASRDACSEGLEWLAEQTDWDAFFGPEALERGYLLWLIRVVPETREHVLPLLKGADLRNADLYRAWGRAHRGRSGLAV